MRLAVIELQNGDCCQDEQTLWNQMVNELKI